jgi:hypothetical protein
MVIPAPKVIPIIGNSRMGIKSAALTRKRESTREVSSRNIRSEKFGGLFPCLAWGKILG